MKAGNSGQSLICDKECRKEPCGQGVIPNTREKGVRVWQHVNNPRESCLTETC